MSYARTEMRDFDDAGWFCLRGLYMCCCDCQTLAFMSTHALYAGENEHGITSMLADGFYPSVTALTIDGLHCIIAIGMHCAIQLPL